MMLEIVNISKSFAVGKGKAQTEVYPLKNATLTIEDGKKVGLIGKSGEGKSTLCNILCGVSPLDCGQVFFDGKPLYSSKRKYDKKLGVAMQLIPQKPLLSLDPSQRVGNAITEALVFSKSAKRGKNAKKKALELFDVVGLERNLFSRLPVHLSGGQAQRAVIARALAVRPKILVCDESTSMLDCSTQKNIVELLNSLVKERGISVLFVSHDEKLVENFCDEIYRLQDGLLALVKEDIKIGEKNEKK